MTAQSQIFFFSFFLVPNKGNKVQVILRIGLLCILLGREKKTNTNPSQIAVGHFKSADINRIMRTLCWLLRSPLMRSSLFWCTGEVWNGRRPYMDFIWILTKYNSVPSRDPHLDHWSFALALEPRAEIIRIFANVSSVMIDHDCWMIFLFMLPISSCCCPPQNIVIAYSVKAASTR